MLAGNFNNFTDLKNIIKKEINQKNSNNLCTAMKKQIIKDFLNENIDKNILLDIARNNKQLSKNPPHIIPQKHNLTYIIKYNIINILSKE